MNQKLLFRKEGFDLLRCRNCQLVFIGNPPNEAELARLYSFASSYHSTLAGDGLAVSLHSQEAATNVAVLSKHARPGRLLDVGCSTGLFLAAAERTGWKVQGLEYSADSAAVAQQRGLQVTQGKLVPGLYKPLSFDVVTMWDVIEHLDHPRQTLATIRDTLVPGGLLFIKTPNIDGLYPRVSLALSPLTGYWGHPEPPGHLYQFSENTLSRLLSTEGFTIDVITHRRIPLRYSFGEPATWFRSLKWLAYCVAFSPLAFIGPIVRAGDDMIVVARKPSH